MLGPPCAEGHPLWLVLPLMLPRPLQALPAAGARSQRGSYHTGAPSYHAERRGTGKRLSSWEMKLPGFLLNGTSRRLSAPKIRHSKSYGSKIKDLFSQQSRQYDVYVHIYSPDHPACAL